MKFLETPLSGAFVVETAPNEDERGSFTRTFCHREFEEHGLRFDVRQTSISYNRKQNTLRGLHYQKAPYVESKLVTCIRGAIYDVIVDLRWTSGTFGQWYAAALSADKGSMMFVPAGFAHGFQTLTDDAEVLYQISEFHHPEAAAGLRWDDPRLAIPWRSSNHIMSERDRVWPFFDEVFSSS